MAAGRQFYSVERRGHRDGYTMTDVDNELLNDGARRAREKEDWVWHGLPEELLSSCDIDDIWKRWRLAMPVCLPRISWTLKDLMSSRIQMFGCPKMLDATCAISYTSRV
jgi:pyroglutamyl-peptidase